MSIWSNYATMIEMGGGYHDTKVHELLTVAGRQAAGARIVEDIERELEENNIGHFPTRLPRDQTARVLLYKKDSAGLGFLLHVVRQLADGTAAVGQETNQQVVQLAVLLNGLRAAAAAKTTSP